MVNLATTTVTAKQSVVCDLCGLTTTAPLYDDGGRAFCCPACREVSALLAAEPVEEKATSVGYDLENARTATLSLAGMWCPSCSWLIDETLQRAPGVIETDVNFLQREARVTYDPEQTEPRQVAKRVRRLGYRAWLPGDTPYDDEEAHWNRLLIAGVLVMHIMLFSFFIYGRDWLGMSSPDTEWLVQFFNLISGVLTVPVLIILGIPILRAGGASLLRGRPNIHTLIALGAFSAFALSVYHLIAGSGRVYFDTTAILLFLVAIGRWLEMQAQKQSTEAVERLFERIPTQAAIVTPAGERTMPVEDVSPGMRVRVRPGERFPVDGLLASGEGDIDESLLTGEPDPVTRQVGERVLAGTYNLDGGFEVIATAVGSDTVAGQIGRLLHQALWRRAPVERLADRLAALMVPTAVVLAGLTFLFWSYVSGMETGFVHALSVLLIACPCALGIATPLTLWLGIGRAAESGVILRNTGVLESLSNIRQIFFDKTGTLSQRAIHLQSVAVDDGVDEANFLALVAALESHSEHPAGQAIATEAGPSTLTVSDFRALPGRGVSGRVANAPFWVGSRRLMEENGLALSSALQAKAEQWQSQGVTVVYAGEQGRVTGLLGLGETIRPEAREMLEKLRAMGVDAAVLTGDDVAAGARWRALLGVPVYAEQTPEDKLNRLRNAGMEVAMVGDGINDGPALAAAAVGVAISDGADVARAAADAVLINDDLLMIPWLFSLSQATMGKVRQNLAWAFVYNIIGLGLAMGGLLQPALAALLMVLSNAVVTTNALRLRKMEIGGRKPARRDEEHLGSEESQPETVANSAVHAATMEPQQP